MLWAIVVMLCLAGLGPVGRWFNDHDPPQNGVLAVLVLIAVLSSMPLVGLGVILILFKGAVGKMLWSNLWHILTAPKRMIKKSQDTRTLQQNLKELREEIAHLLWKNQELEELSRELEPLLGGSMSRVIDQWLHEIREQIDDNKFDIRWLCRWYVRYITEQRKKINVSTLLPEIEQSLTEEPLRRMWDELGNPETRSLLAKIK